jgi:eukaryotic-like serine/threonine-protein kinase
LLTGQRPFGDERMEANQFETLKKLTERRRSGLPEKAFAELPAKLPRGLQEVLTNCLAPEAKDRPATAGRLSRQLDLCLLPRVQELLRPPVESKRHWLRRWPLTFFILIGLTPSAIFSYFNLLINGKEIMGKTQPEVQDFFNYVEVPVINGVMFPIAVFLVVRFAWPAMQQLRRAANRQELEAAALSKARTRALWVGDYAAWLGMALWIVTGLAFPTWLHLHFGAIEGAGLREFESFLASQIASGGISSTITFFLLNLLMVHVYLPVLVRPDEPAADEVSELVRLERRCGWCIYATVAATFIALGLVVVSISGELVKLWMGILTFIGVVCCIASLKLLQVIRTDLDTLAIALDPARISKSS